MLIVEIKDGDQKVAELAATEKIFKTGSRGYFGMDKIVIGEKRYQVQIQMVEIGSKPKTKARNDPARGPDLWKVSEDARHREFQPTYG